MPHGCLVAGLLCIGGQLAAQQPTVTPFMTKIANEAYLLGYGSVERDCLPGSGLCKPTQASGSQSLGEIEPSLETFKRAHGGLTPGQDGFGHVRRQSLFERINDLKGGKKQGWSRRPFITIVKAA